MYSCETANFDIHHPFPKKPSSNPTAFPQTANPSTETIVRMTDKGQVRERCVEVRLLLLDCDGVLTDGSILLDDRGVETKRFHVRDGSAIKLWKKSGGQVGIISGREGQAVRHRAKELGIEILHLGVGEKMEVVQQVLDQLGMVAAQLCFVGDDLADLPPVQQAGLGVAWADACEELKEAAYYVTAARGGHGAVRETVELLLKHQQRWASLVGGPTQHG